MVRRRERPRACTGRRGWLISWWKILESVLRVVIYGDGDGDGDGDDGDYYILRGLCK